MTARSLLLLLVLPMVLTIGCAAEAPEEEEMGDTESHVEKSAERPVAESREIVNQAISDRLVGEEPTGYLGFVTGDARGTKKAANDLAKHVAAINEERRAIYAGVLLVMWMSAKMTVCSLFENLSDGVAYLTEEGKWVLRTNEAPVKMPSFCPQVAAPSAKR